MSDRRKSDVQTFSKFRPSRFIKDSGKWYYYTREGSLEGPFGFRSDAEQSLDRYKKIMASGFMRANTGLTLQPLEQGYRK